MEEFDQLEKKLIQWCEKLHTKIPPHIMAKYIFKCISNLNETLEECEKYNVKRWYNDTLRQFKTNKGKSNE